MRYTVNGELPYYASITEARKAAIESGKDLAKQHDGYLLIAAICDDELNIKGLVVKNDNNYLYNAVDDDLVHILNLDGTIGNVYALRGSDAEAPLFYLVDEHGHDIPFDNMKDLCIKFNMICDKWGVDGYMSILDKDRNTIGVAFTYDELRFCYYENRVREIKPNGIFGKVRRDFKIDLTTSPVSVTKLMGVL